MNKKLKEKINSRPERYHFKNCPFFMIVKDPKGGWNMVEGERENDGDKIDHFRTLTLARTEMMARCKKHLLSQINLNSSRLASYISEFIFLTYLL